jgi:hypothetical protein
MKGFVRVRGFRGFRLSTKGETGPRVCIRETPSLPCVREKPTQGFAFEKPQGNFSLTVREKPAQVRGIRGF